MMLMKPLNYFMVTLYDGKSIFSIFLLEILHNIIKLSYSYKEKSLRSDFSDLGLFSIIVVQLCFSDCSVYQANL